MKKATRSLFLFIFLLSCIERFEFVIEDTEPQLVIEGSISDKSFNETLSYPSDGRYFIVKLRYTSDVTNQWGEAVTGATVQILISSGDQIDYTDLGDGVYSILDPDFKALPDLEYKLKVHLPTDDTYESAWEKMAIVEDSPIGEIEFDEIEKQSFKYQGGKKVVVDVKGVDAFLQLPVHDNSTLYYKWNFTPHWIYVAPLPPLASPVKKCWVLGEERYLTDYTLQEDLNGGYRKKLFFLATTGNERVLEEFTLLVQQQIISKDYYFFLKEMQEQDQGALLSDKPPFNLRTNFTSSNEQKSVTGYFSVSKEQATRWYFDRFDLTYPLQNNLKQGCEGTGGPFTPAPECSNCLDYLNGEPSIEKPSWWR
jgi:hypothetical protein